jgi:hypothetical protein
LTLEIHRSKSIRSGGGSGFDAESLFSLLQAPPRSWRWGGERREAEEEERGTGRGGEVVICAGCLGAGWKGNRKRLGWLAHSLVLATARDGGGANGWEARIGTGVSFSFDLKILILMWAAGLVYGFLNINLY